MYVPILATLSSCAYGIPGLNLWKYINKSAINKPYCKECWVSSSPNSRHIGNMKREISRLTEDCTHNCWKDWAQILTVQIKMNWEKETNFLIFVNETKNTFTKQIPLQSKTLWYTLFICIFFLKIYLVLINLNHTCWHRCKMWLNTDYCVYHKYSEKFPAWAEIKKYCRINDIFF